TLLTNGNLVVTWSENILTVPDPSGIRLGTFAQILSPTGTKVGGVITVAHQIHRLLELDVVPLPDGEFTVMLLNAAAAFADGTVLAVSEANDGSGDGIFARVLKLGVGGNDFLGASGADAMAGGPGDDRYLVNDPNDVVTEAPSEGVDTIYTFL